MDLPSSLWSDGMGPFVEEWTGSDETFNWGQRYPHLSSDGIPTGLILIRGVVRQVKPNGDIVEGTVYEYLDGLTIMRNVQNGLKREITTDDNGEV